MKPMKLSTLFVLILIVAVFACQSNRQKAGELSQVNVIANDSLRDLIASKDRYDQLLAENGIGILGLWGPGENKNDTLIYLTKKKPADDKNPLGGESLRIYDSNYKLIFEEEAVSFGGIEVISMIHRAKRQLVIKSINDGGSGRFFQILDFQEGKIVNLTDPETLYSGEVAIFPQYQDGKKHFTAPLQVFLNDYLISSSPTASVLRFSNGKYTNVGELDLVEVGKSIDKNISKK